MRNWPLRRVSAAYCLRGVCDGCNYPGSARRRETPASLTRPPLTRGLSRPRNPRYGGPPAVDGPCYTSLLPAPPSVALALLLLYYLQRQQRQLRPPSTGPTVGRPSTSSFSCRARETRPKNTNKAFNPKQREWRVSSPLSRDVSGVAGRPAAGVPLLERPLGLRRASPRLGILRRQGLRGQRARA
jgi:hypothetical protein